MAQPTANSKKNKKLVIQFPRKKINNNDHRAWLFFGLSDRKIFLGTFSIDFWAIFPKPKAPENPKISQIIPNIVLQSLVSTGAFERLRIVMHDYN